MKDKICINCIHKDVCYMYRLNYISAREGYCINYYEEPKKSETTIPIKEDTHKAYWDNVGCVEEEEADNDT